MSTIESVAHETRVFDPSPEFVAQANVNKAEFDRLNAAAAADFSGFWAKLARDTLLWHKPFTTSLDESRAPFYKWFEDGEINASYNCLERNLQSGNADRTAIIFEADDGAVTRVTYQELYHRVCRLANGLKSRGIKKGDRVIIYIPMSIEGVVAMQACARIGATHSVVFGGFSAKSLQERIIDAGAVAIITAAAARRCRSRRSSTRRSACAAAKRSTPSSCTGAPAIRLACRRDAMCGCTSWSRTRRTPASRYG